MEIYTDGGEDKYCFVIPDKNIVKTFEKKGITNNEAEYLAVIEALKHVEHGSRVKILTDSKLVANQLRMEWHIKEKRLRLLFGEVFDIIEKKSLSFEIEWIPRSNFLSGQDRVEVSSLINSIPFPFLCVSPPNPHQLI